MDENITKLIDNAVTQTPWVQNSVTSLFVIIAFVILRTIIVHFIKRKTEILDKDQRRWINRINNTTSIMIFIGLVLLWAPQLQTFALSLTAVAVAIVLTTKELLMCLTGGFLRASSKPFEVGDWVTIDNVSGEVMQITATMTLIEKLDIVYGTYDHTGETIQIPNSRFLTANVENLNFIKEYIYHTFHITIPLTDLNPEEIQTQLSAITGKAVEPFIKKAIEFNKTVERKTGIDFADAHPHINLKTTDLGHYKFLIRVFIPIHKVSEIESAITLPILKYCYDLRQSITPKEDQCP